QGESAIEKLLDVLADVRKIKWPSNETFGETTCNVGIIAGGRRPNVIPAEAEAALQIRLVTSADAVKTWLEGAVGGRASLEFASAHDPQRMLAVEGFDSTIVRFTTDIPYLSNWGTPLLIGPGSILDAHTARERVAKRELLRAVQLYTDLAHILLSRVKPFDASKGAAE
ncbi:MAG: peptidase dimerization domain-containing protein, partial [Burkholderiales bacterium]